MSLIHTCELNRVNPFDYLTELQRHAEELKQKPSVWMPWNYRRRWRGSPRPRPRNMIGPAWPKKIVWRRAERFSSNTHETGLSKS